MKKSLVLAASLMLAASPAAAQQSVSDAPVVTAPAAVTAAAPAASAQLFPTRDEVRLRVAEAESKRAQAPIGSQGWWYTVAAVALGVIIALLLLD